MKIIAYYLPQFHTIPENDEWWGEGFTEWRNVRAAKPLYKGHNQPRIPLNNNYYNLLNPETLIWQSSLAEQYGIYGFCFYHYWFQGKLLLEKPVELYKNTAGCKTHYCICWANGDWTNGWVSSKNEILIPQRYGEKEDWKSHFLYFLPHFKDERYIKIDNKPVLVVYSAHEIHQLREMLEYWKQMAIKSGFDGLIVASQSTYSLLLNYKGKELLDYHIEYQPQLAYTGIKQQKFETARIIKRRFTTFLKRNCSLDISRWENNLKWNSSDVSIYNYDDIWDGIIYAAPTSEKSIPGAFVNWDNTPRKGKRGFVINGASPEKFHKNMIRQIVHAQKDYHKDYLFLFAWNEWAGGVLEPDEYYGYGYLDALQKAMLDAKKLI